MAGKESNPIQQRIELLTERWEVAAANPRARIIRIHAQENEKDMVDAFYTYLLGVDTSNNDVPIIFESIYEEANAYTTALLNELKELIHTWNTANKDAIPFQTEPIIWKPDYKLVKENNPAYTFVENMNRLANYLRLDESVFLVAIMKVSFVEASSFRRWLGHCLESGIGKKLRILIDDTVDNPYYEKLSSKYPNEVITLKPELDMDNAMQQIAAMGNPNDPGVQYRKEFIALTQAIGGRKEKEALKHATTCIEIANKNLEKNPYWIGQVIAVNAALANDQVGYKNFRKAIVYATDGVNAAIGAKELIPDEFIYRKFVAQATMLRGSLYTAAKNMEGAIEDFTVAANHYTYTNDVILAMEAYRMLGVCYKKSGSVDAACKALADAVTISRQVPQNIVRLTTFAGIVEMLFPINNQKYITQEELEEVAETVYGENWATEIRQWKNPRFEQIDDPSKVVVA